MNRYRILASSRFSILGLPMPFAERLRYLRTWDMESEFQPTREEIEQRAIQLDISLTGLQIHAITLLDQGYDNFDPPGPIIDES